MAQGIEIDGRTGERKTVEVPQQQIDSLLADQAPTADHVRAEAHRRVVAFMPEYRQRNALARSQELQEARETRPLTADEEAEAQVIRESWEWIKSIRRSSNILEPNPPADYRDDIHWPVMPV